jgi:hypothetical protein
VNYGQGLFDAHGERALPDVNGNSSRIALQLIGELPEGGRRQIRDGEIEDAVPHILPAFFELIFGFPSSSSLPSLSLLSPRSAFFAPLTQLERLPAGVLTDRSPVGSSSESWSSFAAVIEALFRFC